MDCLKRNKEAAVEYALAAWELFIELSAHVWLVVKVPAQRFLVIFSLLKFPLFLHKLPQ